MTGDVRIFIGDVELLTV
ncbi:hypothetical protein M3590_09755 [Priestia koreensis]|nr:hypothetical protein [Priestia koreensis]